MAEGISYPPVDTGALATAASVAALAATVPTMAAALPPGVADVSAVGANTNQFTGPAHTHASKARKQRLTGVNTATYTWTYPAPFGAGVVPICNAIVEDPANSASDSYNVQIVGAPTASQVVFRIIRQTSGLFGLLLGAIGFNSTPGNVNIHALALEP